jgi:hypothetical protein
MSDDDAYPRLHTENDRLCGYNNLSDLIQDGKAVWYIKNVKKEDSQNRNHYIISSGYDDLNKCLMFSNSGKSLYPTKFSWGYSNKNLCGASGGQSGLENSIGRVLWEINPVGGNKFTINNTSNTDSNNVWNGATPADATSAPKVVSDINSPSPIAISRMTTIPAPYCLAMINDNIPQRFVAYDNPDNKVACGFNSFNELIEDSRAVWYFYKINPSDLSDL